MNAKISVFVIYVEAIMYLFLCNLHDLASNLQLCFNFSLNELSEYAMWHVDSCFCHD